MSSTFCSFTYELISFLCLLAITEVKKELETDNFFAYKK